MDQYITGGWHLHLYWRSLAKDLVELASHYSYDIVLPPGTVQGELFQLIALGCEPYFAKRVGCGYLCGDAAGFRPIYIDTRPSLALALPPSTTSRISQIWPTLEINTI
jgi:hypothetical protein